jgi:hypothetical protein
MQQDDCPGGKCVMAEFIEHPEDEEDDNVLYLGINCINRIRTGWNNGLDESCYNY